MRHLFISFIALCAASTAVAQQPLRVVVDGKPQDITVERLRSAGADTLTVSPHHGSPVRYSVAPLLKVLSLAGVRSDTLRGPGLTTVVTAVASDNYRVSFTLGEMALGGKSVLIAFAENGHALDSTVGPYRLVVPSDERQARWARQVVELRVTNASP